MKRHSLSQLWEMAAKNPTNQSPNLLTSPVAVMPVKKCQLKAEGICEILVSFVFILRQWLKRGRSNILRYRPLEHEARCGPFRAGLWVSTLGICMLPNLGMQQILRGLAGSSVFLGIKLSQRSLKEAVFSNVKHLGVS